MKQTGTNYQAWDIKEKDFPIDGDMESKIRFLIGYGILAPSTHNTQPWLFEINKNKLLIKPDKDYRLIQADPTGRNLYISLGACAFNIIVAGAKFGLSDGVKFESTNKNDGEIALTFHEAGSTDKGLVKLFPAISKRYSDKRILPLKPLSEASLEKLRTLQIPSATIGLTIDSVHIEQLSRLCFKAAASYASQPAFGRELSQWLRGNKTIQGDGMTGTVSGLSSGKALMGKTILKLQPKAVKVMAKKYLKMLQTSPALGVINTPGDTWEDWIRAGMAYEHLALLATSYQISLSPMAALIERPERKLLRNYFSSTSGKPQMFFRLVGVEGSPIHSPRRFVTRQLAEFTLLHNLQKAGVNATLKNEQVGQYKINYVTAGKGQPLLLIHGANIGWGQWLPNFPELAKHFKLIAIDLPGCGGSTAVPFKELEFEQDYVNTIANFLKQLGLKNTMVVGHSFGGAIAIKLARRPNPSISKLVLVNPLGLSRFVPGKQKPVTLGPLTKLISRTAVKPTRLNMQTFLAQPVVNKRVITDDLTNYYWTAVTSNPHNHPLLFMNSLTQPLKLKKDLLLTKEIAKLKQPSLIIMGDTDAMIPIKKIKPIVTKIPQIKLEVYANTGHVPSLEKSDQFNKSVIEFLR